MSILLFVRILENSSMHVLSQISRRERLHIFFRYWLPAVVWAAFIFYLSSIPSLESGLTGLWDGIARKAAHAAVYAVLTVLLARVFAAGYGVEIKRALVLAALFSLLYAVSDEYHQAFVSGRHGRLQDVVVDAIGIVVALVFVWSRKVAKIEKPPH